MAISAQKHQELLLDCVALALKIDPPAEHENLRTEKRLFPFTFFKNEKNYKKMKKMKKKKDHYLSQHRVADRYE